MCYGDTPMNWLAAEREMRKIVPAFQSSDYRVTVILQGNGSREYSTIENFIGGNVFTVFSINPNTYGRLSKAVVAPCDFVIITNREDTMLQVKKGQYLVEKPNGTLVVLGKKAFNKDYKEKEGSPVLSLVRELNNCWQHV